MIFFVAYLIARTYKTHNDGKIKFEELLNEMKRG